MKKKRRIIINDDGWIITLHKALTTPQTIKELMVDTYEGSPVDTVCWCVGDHEVYEYETEQGERFGALISVSESDSDSGKVNKHRAVELQRSHFENEVDYWTHKNLNHLIKSSGGPLTEITKQFHQAGIDLFPSVRMNSHYAIPYSSPHYGSFRRQNPHLLIGHPDEYIPNPTLEYAIKTGLDYKYPEVRAHMLGIICELLGRFEVDGIELDFMRHPAFFRPEEAYSNRYLMTDFLRQIRQSMDSVKQVHHKHIDLLVRVPPTLHDCVRIGLDVPKWIDEHLVDIVAAGGGFIPFEMPIGEFVETARNSDVRIFGSLEALRWALDEEVLRALASKFWDAGADGIYFFNYFNTANAWKRVVLNDLVDHQRLPRLNKRYELDHTDRIASKQAHIGAFRYAIPPASLPVFMEETEPNGGSVLSIKIADDVETASKAGFLQQCVLSCGFDNFGEKDMLEVKLNEEKIPWESHRIFNAGWSHLIFDGKVYNNSMSSEVVPGTLIQFDLSSPPLQYGLNELKVRFIKGDTPRFKPVMLKEVRLDIVYVQE